MMKKLLIILLFVAGLSVLTGCGGGAAPVTVTYYSDIDGTVFSNGNVTPPGTTQMGVGDNGDNVGLQDLLSFTLDLPAGAQIKTATLRLRNCDFTGTSFPSNILVEHLQTDFGALDASDFAATPESLTSCGEFSSLTINGWNELDVTASAQEDQALARGKSQFRLYRIPVTDGDGQWDNNAFYTSENGTNIPELVITYTL